MPRLFAFLVILVSSTGLLHGQCEPSPAVREILDKATSKNPERNSLLAKGLKQYPDDYFLLRRQFFLEEDEDARFVAVKSAWEKNPGQPIYELIYAETLVGRNTPEAIRMLERLGKSHPELSRARLALARLSMWGKFKDTARAKSELEAFLEACPAPLDAGVLSRFSGSGPREKAAAQGVRARLLKEDPAGTQSVWEALWRVEFKMHPPAEHAAVRKQIAEDLARLAQRPDAGEIRWMETLRNGYQSAGDPAGMERMSERILESYPTSDEAESIVQERWRKKHPYPRNANQEQLEAWSREALKTHQEWHARWPDDSLIFNTVFTSMADLPETKPEEIARAGDELMALYRKNPNWYGMPPVEFRVATEFTKHKVNLDKVPGLVDEACRAAAKRDKEQLASDSNPPEIADMVRRSAENMKVERARVLLDYYEASGQPGKAREIDTELATLHPDKPYLKSSLQQAQAHAAELLGRKLDALLMYRAALEMRQSFQKPAGGKDPLADNIERLWKELGGTAAARPLLTDTRKAQEAAESRWERPTKPLPAFTLSDLEGKTWKLASLEGKTVLINLWATWCGPCRAEHPDFQKLYDKLKGRSDVTVLTFNIDDDPGKVSPYMQENKYTFPVLLASEFVNAYLAMTAIPQNWFIDATGKLQWIQVGFSSDPAWQAGMTAKLEEVIKLRP